MILHIFPRNRQFYKKRNMHFKSSCFGILLLCLAVHSGSFGQELFEKEHLQKIDSTINQYKEKDKYKYLNLLPQVSYDALNNSFNIGFSLSGLSNYYQQKKRNKIQLAQLEARLKDKLDNDLERLNLDIEKFYFQYENLQSKIEIFKIDFDLFQITKGKYNNSEITTEQFLQLKKAYLINERFLKSEFFRLKYAAKKINIKAKNKKFLDTIIVLKNQINNYKITRITEMLKE